MNFDSQSLYPLFEKSLIRIAADFESDKDPRSVVSELSSFLKTKVSSSDPSSYNFQLKRTEDGVYHLITSFLMYRDSRLVIINLLKWIERNGKTYRNHNLIIDLKFLDAEKGPFKGTLLSNSLKIETVDKLKFILEFDEEKIYESFPSRKDSFNSQSIQRFDVNQKFMPKESDIIDPKFYTIPSTKNCGINFDSLIDGYLRMQYLGGSDYEKKVQEILSAINQFCVTSWDSCINKKLSSKNIKKFEIIINFNKKIRESYYDYDIFIKNFPDITFTVDLMDDKKMLYSYYQTLRDRIYDIFSNLTFKKNIELNYDTSISTFQLRESTIEVKNVSQVEFINCKIENGNFFNCDFYECEIENSDIHNCNLFLNTIAKKCNFHNSFINRTVKVEDCDIEGMNGVFNGDMQRSIFRNGKMGLFATISKDSNVIQYNPLKSGYLVAGDNIIIPTKKFRQM